MMKFFRKYNKALLAVFMAMLMIVFIGGSALETMLQPSMNRLVARSRLGNIMDTDQNHANAVTKLLEVTGMDWRNPLGPLGTPLEVVDWVLLTREAASLGSGPNVAAAKSAFAELSLDDRARQLRAKPSDILTAIAELNSIQQTALAVAGSTAISETAVQAAARDALETAKAEFVLLPAKAFFDDSLNFSEDEMKAHFEKYKSGVAGEGLNFGYFIEPGLKVDFVEISRDKLAEEVKVVNLDRRAHEYYDERKASDPQFKLSAEVLGSPDVFGPPRDPYLSWEEARPMAEATVRKQRADQAVTDLANRILQTANEDWADAPREATGYKTPPDKVKRPDYFEEVLKRLPPSKATIVWRSNWFTDKDASSVSVIGTTLYMSERGAPRPFRELAFKTQAVVSDVASLAKNEGINANDYTAMYQVNPYVLKNRMTGNAYVFRVMESRPGRPAESIDEVRDRVVADMRTLRAFERAKVLGDALVNFDTEESLKAAFDKDDELVDARSLPAGKDIVFAEPPPFSRASKFQAHMGRPKEGMLVGAGVGHLPVEVLDSIFALEWSHAKRAMFALPDRGLVVAVEWKETTRPTDEDFTATRQQIMSQMVSTRRQDTMSRWLDPEQIRLRNGFEVAAQ